MLLVLCGWLIILLSNFFMGEAFLRLFPAHKDKQIPLSLTIVIGLCVQGVLCNVLYFFTPLNHQVFLGLTLLLFLGRRSVYKFSKFSFSSTKFRYLDVLLVLILLIYTLLLVASPFFFFDEQFYYISTIQWIQKYPVVKGLAHLHRSFGLMSSWHVLTAFYTIPFKTSTALQELNGYLYLVFLMYIIEAKKHFSQSTYHALLIFFILFNITVLGGFIASVSSDTASALFIAFILSLLYEYEHKTKEASLLNICMIILVVFTVSVKITNFFLIPLLLFIIRLEKRARWVLLIFCGINIGAYLFRNLFLTGYFFYPITEVGRVTVDWKVEELLNKGYFFWYYRFATRDSWQTILYLRFIKYNPIPVVVNYIWAALSVVFSVLLLVSRTFQKRGGQIIYERLLKHKYSVFLFSSALLIHIFLIPSFKSTYVIRFIFGVIFWINAFWIVKKFEKFPYITQVYKALVIIVVFIQLSINIATNSFKNIGQYFVAPKNYEVTPGWEKHKIDGQWFYVLKEKKYFCGGRFPCVYEGRFQLRGESIKDGFRKKAPNNN